MWYTVLWTTFQGSRHTSFINLSVGGGATVNLLTGKKLVVQPTDTICGEPIDLHVTLSCNFIIHANSAINNVDKRKTLHLKEIR